MLAAVETPDWTWFETGLAYDNARLPQALIVTGTATGERAHVEAGLRALRWLVSVQTAPAGLFPARRLRNVRRAAHAAAAFDQQPLEAAATISACLAAWRADGDAGWRDAAARAFDWFFGAQRSVAAAGGLRRPAPAATACIPTARTRTGAASLSCRIC